ncbi:MAG: metalloprotease PmbA [Gammaproteobacteria bacterium]
MNQALATDYNAPETLDRLALEVLERATAHGVDAAEVAVSAGEGLAVTVRDGAAETVEHERDKSLAVTVYRGGRKGSATTTDFSGDALAETVAAACRIAEHGEVDEHAGLAAPAYLATSVPDLDLDHPWDIDAQTAIALALECERAALAHDRRIRQSDGVSVNCYRGTRAYANSHGFHGAYRGTRHSISAVMIGADDAGMQRSYWYSSNRRAALLEPAESIGRTAAARTVARLGARRIATTTLPVIFEYRVAAGLLGHLVGAISGGAQYRRASFLLDALDEQVLPATLSLEERPYLPAGAASAPFDNDGVATREKTIVDSGRLATYLLGAYAARRLGRAPTGNAGGTHNLLLTPGTRSLEEMVGALDRGLLVTDLMGFGVNAVTGDYSRGASGFLIEHGERAHPVEEITIAGNLKTMLLGIVEVGADLDPSAAVQTGSILVDRMTVAGDSAT